MQFKTKIIYSALFSAIILITSIIIPLVPCRTAPAVPPYSYKWSLCALNPDTIRSVGAIKQFFGYTSSLTDSYFILLIISFALAMVFFHFAGKKKKEKIKKGGKYGKRNSRNSSMGCRDISITCSWFWDD